MDHMYVDAIVISLTVAVVEMLLHGYLSYPLSLSPPSNLCCMIKMISCSFRHCYTEKCEI